MYKVGIITYHYHYNYGTMLQALALQEVIENLGFNSEIINFKQNNKLDTTSLMKLRLKRSLIYLKNLNKYFVLFQNRKKIEQRKNLFEKFYISEIKKGSKKYNITKELVNDSPKYDAYIVGSDQTWNPYASERPEAFYLPFVKNNLKKGAYAPSLAVNELTKEQEEFLKKYLSDFSFLSCREKTGANLLEKILKRKVDVVLDPTLLLTKKEWESKENKNLRIEEPYILTYFLGENKKHREIVKKISEKLSLKIIALPMTYIEMENKDIEKYYIGPKEFLTLIKNSSLICTDSFHGTIFSINYEKNFYSFCKMNKNDKKSENSRLLDILEEFNLEERLISEIPKEIKDIEYVKVKQILDIKRRESKDYLEKMLKKMTLEEE